MEYRILHAGTKGMHWGERHYQHPDGTWTELGKKRRRIGNRQIAKAQKKQQREEARAERRERKKQEAIASGNARKINKYRSEMTDEEVREAIDRINMTTSLDRVTEQQKQVAANRVGRIKNTMNNAVDIYDTTAAIANATGLLEKELPVLFKDQKRKKDVTLFGDKKDGRSDDTKNTSSQQDKADKWNYSEARNKADAVTQAQNTANRIRDLYDESTTRYGSEDERTQILRNALNSASTITAERAREHREYNENSPISKGTTYGQRAKKTAQDAMKRAKELSLTRDAREMYDAMDAERRAQTEQRVNDALAVVNDMDLDAWERNLRRG